MRDPGTVGAGSPRPGEICRLLLAALEASEGRRRRRKRDTTADAIGLRIKHRLLEEAARADPDPEAFEGWLLTACMHAEEAGLGLDAPSGPVLAMASEIMADWRLARHSEVFREWLQRGAVSDDRP